jgi:hypothetical protein
MHVTPLDVAAGLVLGTLGSVAGGYLAGTSLNTKAVGRELAGYLGMLYGPAAGATGVVVGLVVVVVLASMRS